MAIFITQPSIYQDLKKTSSPYRSQTVALGLCIHGILIETIGRVLHFEFTLHVFAKSSLKTFLHNISKLL